MLNGKYIVHLRGLPINLSWANPCESRPKTGKHVVTEGNTYIIKGDW
jgi:hypothetical protein